MASTFNAFELLQGNGAAATSKKKKSKKKTPTAAEAHDAPTCSKESVDGGTTKPVNGTKSTKTRSYQVEVDALIGTLPSTGKQRVDLWGSWVTKASNGQTYTFPGDHARVPYALVFHNTPALEHTMQTVVSHPPTPTDITTLRRALHALFDPAGLEAAADGMVDTAVSLGKAMVGASSELQELACDAVSSIAHNLRSTAAVQLVAAYDMQGQLASIDAEVHALQQAMQRSSNNAWDHMAASTNLINALEKHLTTLIQPSTNPIHDQPTPAEWFLAVLKTRNQSPSSSSNGTAPSALLTQLKTTEAALAQQASSLAADIAAAEATLRSLKAQAAEVDSALHQNRHRQVALFQQGAGDAAGLERAAMVELERLVGLVTGGVATGNGKVNGGVRGEHQEAVQRYIQGVEQHILCLDRLQSEALKSLEFNLERLVIATEQEQRMRFLNMQADADKPAKTKADRTAKVQDALRTLSNAHQGAQRCMNTLDGVLVAQQGVVGGDVRGLRDHMLGKLEELRVAFDNVADACRAQGVTV